VAKLRTFPNSTISTSDELVAKVLTMAHNTKRLSNIVSILVEAQLYTAQGRGLAATILRVSPEELERMLEVPAVAGEPEGHSLKQNEVLASVPVARAIKEVEGAGPKFNLDRLVGSIGK